MFLVKRIIMITCAKNYKSKFTLVEVIQEKVQTLFSGHGVHKNSPVVH